MLTYLKDGENFFNKEKLTWQEIIFYCCVGNVVKYRLFSDDEKNMIKKKYLLWQNNPTPKMNKTLAHFLHNFNHDDDMTWNSLNVWLDICEKEYSRANTKVSQEIIDMISDEFPF